jgi:hypothetical protein
MLDQEAEEGAKHVKVGVARSRRSAACAEAIPLIQRANQSPVPVEDQQLVTAFRLSNPQLVKSDR